MRSEAFSQYVSNDPRFRATVGLPAAARQAPAQPGHRDRAGQDPALTASGPGRARRRRIAAAGAARQREHEARAAAGAVGQRERCRPCARRARGRSRGRARSRPRRRGAAAVEALEDPLALLRRDARPAVGDLDGDRVGALRRGHADRLAAAVAQRVVDQDPHDAGDRVGVAAAPARRRSAGPPRARSRARPRAARTPPPPRAPARRARPPRSASAPRRRAARGRAAPRPGVESRSSSRRAIATWRCASARSSRPSCRSSSSSSIVPWSIVSGVRSSCEAVATNARRADSWRRSSSCMRAERAGEVADLVVARVARHRDGRALGGDPQRGGAQPAEAPQQRAGQRDRERDRDEQADAGGREQRAADLLDGVGDLGQAAPGDDHARPRRPRCRAGRRSRTSSPRTSSTVSLAVDRPHGGEEGLARRRPALGVGEEARAATRRRPPGSARGR